jgi:hypothetical protein
MLADYYARSAVAAAQVLAGFDEQWFRERLEAGAIGVSVGQSATADEGRALADLVVRLVARLYPCLAIIGEPAQTTELRRLALDINPGVEFHDSAETGIVIGDGAAFTESVYSGSDSWHALISTQAIQPVGETDNPFGPGLAACIAAGILFRRRFLPTAVDEDTDLRVSAIGSPPDDDGWTLAEPAVLVGAGAVGQSALWALSRAPLTGTLHVVDMERVELSNLQRYVLAQRTDEGRIKVELAASVDSRALEFVPHDGDLASFLSSRGYRWDAMLLALDSARDRIAAQASLPRFVANAWTQTDDLGVSAHSQFGGPGACVACLYLPDGPRKNEDELVAETLGVPHLQLQVRALLATGQPVDRPLLEAVSAAIGQPLDRLLPFEGRTVRELYVEGFCGGAVIPVGDAGRLQAGAGDVHVPLAHQSAMAGVLLAAALVEQAASGAPAVTHARRVDVIRNPGQLVDAPMRARRDGRCLCDDIDFVEAYESKYGSARGAD